MKRDIFYKYKKKGRLAPPVGLLRWSGRQILFAEHFVYAVQKVLRTERFGDVVVYFSDVQAKHFIDALRLGCDNDDRNISEFFIGFYLLVYFPTAKSDRVAADVLFPNPLCRPPRRSLRTRDGSK
jgi:hypothetical protein